jgi:hypothetical protein
VHRAHRHSIAPSALILILWLSLLGASCLAPASAVAAEHRQSGTMASADDADAFAARAHILKEMKRNGLGTAVKARARRVRSRQGTLPSLGAPTMSASAALNPIQLENAQPGDPNWFPSGLAASDPTIGDIEGYASAASVKLGETIDLHVSTRDRLFIATLYRIGWYNGDGARRLLGPGFFAGSYHHNDVYVDAATGLVEANNWPITYRLTISPSWTSGVYAVQLISDGSISGQPHLGYIIFVVRDDSRPSDFLFQTSVNTYHAYNNWGGKSLYAANSTQGQPAVKVSFNRPYADAWGSGDFAFWEINLLRFLEREGYDVSYTTDLDTDRDGLTLWIHKAFLAAGHDEYWSAAMRQNIEFARELGKHLGFFGANACYWQIRYESSPLTGEDYRTIVAYKEQAATADPLALDGDPTNDEFITTQWRLNLLGHPADPEDHLIGEKYHGGGNGDVVVAVPDDPTFQWIFDGTGLGSGNGTVLKGLLGYETDSATDPDSAPPPGTVLLAHSPDAVSYSDMTIYQWGTSWAWWVPPAKVFATGTMQWSWGLDDFDLAGNIASPVAQQMTRNVLDCFAGRRAC